jgi:hypothetical protein
MNKRDKATLSFCKNLHRIVLPEISFFRPRLQHLLLLLWLIVFSALFIPSSYAQTDTLTVRGKIENLTVRLYRQAPEITVARVNILQSNQEIVRVAQLQPDGSFELKMPLVYPLEECYVTYANVVMPFLGEKGTVEITLNGDSLTKSEVPIRFGGAHAATNNRHAHFYVAFNKWLKANPEKPIKAATGFHFWEKVAQERDRKIDFYRTSQTVKDTLLDKWVISSLNDAAKARFYSYLLREKQKLALAISASTELDTNLFFTFAKADSYRQFTNYTLASTPNLPESSLPVNTLARLILQYVPNISTTDSLKLVGYVQGETAKMRELRWLSNLFNQKEDTLRLIAAYELYTRKFGAAHSAKELDYLNAVFYAENTNNFTLKNTTLWYNHLRPGIKNPYYVRSLDELHHIANLDSALIRATEPKMSDATLNNPLEVVSGVLLTNNTSSSDETLLWDQLKRKFKGKNVYFIFWTNDELGRNALAEANALRALLPEKNIAFVYLAEHKISTEVWMEAIIKSKSRGWHIKLDEAQNDYFAAIWDIDHAPYCVLIDANGKFIKRDAPLPSDREEWDKIWDKVLR